MESITAKSISIHDGRPWLSPFRGPVLGIALVGAAMIALCACQPGSSAAKGVDPGIVDIPVAFIKRPIPLDDMGMQIQADMRDPLLFSTGGDVYLRSSTAVGASLTNISNVITEGQGDVKGLNASYDGSRLIFSLRLFDPDPDDDIVPSWNIYEYDVGSRQLRRVIADALTAEAGDDLFPCYLPDGRIVFTSNRQKQAGENLINEGKPSYRALVENGNTLALVLHVMNADGTNLRQISFNQSHDLYPQVLSNLYGGKIVFSRWDKAVVNDSIHLYTINPDGSELELLYGLNSHFTGSNDAEIQFASTREMENGDLMVITRPFTGTFGGGNIEIIDAARFVDNEKAVWSLAGLEGPAQQPATINAIVNDGTASIAGRYGSAFPLWDGSNRILVSKSTCQLNVGGELQPCVEPYLSDPDAVESSPAYAIWLYDRNEDTEKPIVLAEPDTIITEAVTVQKRILPPIRFDKAGNELDSGQLADNVGVVNIKSVYDMADGGFDGCFFGHCSNAAGIDTVQDFADPRNSTAAQRPARFVRFIKPVAFPARNDPTLANPPNLNGNAFGLRRSWGMREILGYAPVEPDGSVKIRVPAGIPLALEVLDGEGRRIGPMHFNWFQVRAGDTLTCNGCHTHNTGGPIPEIHGRPDAGAPSINSGLPATLQFVNTLIPGTSGPYWGNFGQTMAEVRFDRVGLAVPAAAEPRLNVDLVFDDYWTDPARDTPDPGFAYRYADLDSSVPSPANDFCTPWQFNCRSVINYPAQIHAIWQIDRGDDLMTPDAPDTPPSNDPTNTPLLSTATPNGVGDDTCIECHTTMGGTRLPYGQLDLTSDPNQNPSQRYRSYNELLLGKPGRIFNGTDLVPITRTVADGMGGFVTENDPAARVRPSMSPNGARASFFMEKMTGTELDDSSRSIGGSVDHSAMLSGAELKLIGEWLDLGGQNFNDPFDPAAPQN
jgi:hypothetical protein